MGRPLEEQHQARVPWGAIMMIGAACSYGLISTILKLSYAHGFSTIEMTTAQYDVACVVLWAIFAVTKRGVPVRRREWPFLALIALVGMSTSVTYFFSLRWLPASVAIVLLFQFTWMVAVMDMVVHRRWMTRWKLVGMLLIFVGTLLAVGVGGGLFRHLSVWGLALGLASGLGYGTQLFLSGYMNAQSSPVGKSAIMVTVSAVVATTLSRPTWIWNGTFLHGLWKWALLSALFAQVIPLLLLAAAVPRIGGRMASVFGAIELPATVLAAFFVLGEPVSAGQWAGSLIILGGVVLSEGIGQG